MSYVNSKLAEQKPIWAFMTVKDAKTGGLGYAVNIPVDYKFLAQ